MAAKSGALLVWMPRIPLRSIQATRLEKAMATDMSFVEYVMEQSGLRERITHKKMFGEYGIYIDGKVVAFACDNSLFVKTADATAAMTADLPRRPPYPVAKPYPVADELLDDSDRLQALLIATAAAMPEPKIGVLKRFKKKRT
jgi:TfoX/Sxy family transcriptional regulator of competence genes